MENLSQQDPTIFNNPHQETLPNGTAVLVLGIISIVGCICYGIVGFICGIIALVLSNRDLASYRAMPSRFTPGSYANLKAGRVCAIIGLSLSAVYIFFVLFIIATVGLSAINHPDQWMHSHSYPY